MYSQKRPCLLKTKTVTQYTSATEQYKFSDSGYGMTV